MLSILGAAGGLVGAMASARAQQKYMQDLIYDAEHDRWHRPGEPGYFDAYRALARTQLHASVLAEQLRPGGITYIAPAPTRTDCAGCGAPGVAGTTCKYCGSIVG